MPSRVNSSLLLALWVVLFAFGLGLSLTTAQAPTNPLYVGCSTVTAYPLNPIFTTATAYKYNLTAIPSYNASTALAPTPDKVEG